MAGKTQSSPISLDPAVYALSAYDHATLGKCIVGETHEFIEAIIALSDVSLLDDSALRRRCTVIGGLSKRARHYAEDMDGLLESVAQSAHDNLEAIKDAQLLQKGGA